MEVDMFKRFVPIFIIALSLCGCVSEVVMNKVVLPTNELENEFGTITVCRKKIVWGDGRINTIFLDNIAIVSGQAGYCFTAKVTPGSHILDLGSNDVCKFKIANREKKYFTAVIENVFETNKDEIDAYSNYTLVKVQD